MRPGRRHLAVLAAASAVLLPVGCGSSDEPKGKPLPPTAVTELTRRLDEVQRRYEVGTNNGNAGACEDIETDSFGSTEGGIDAIVEALPDDVDADVRTALDESLARLRELARDGCSGVEETPTEQEPAPPQPDPEPTIPEEPTPEETNPQKGPPTDKKPKKDPDTGDGGDAGGPVVPDGGSGGQIAPPPEGN